MATTSSSALRYPTSTAAPNIPQDIQNLATDLDRKVLPSFASVAARNAAIPSPTQGQSCTVAGVLHTHDGTGWRFRRSGNISVETDTSGRVIFAHGGGVTPRAWGLSPRSQATDQINAIIGALAAGEDATNLTARFTRSDTNAYLASTLVPFYWWAEF